MWRIRTLVAEPGPSPDHLSYLRRVASDLRAYGFFALVRGVESRAQSLPRVGNARIPSQNAIDLGHTPTLEFPASTLAELEMRASGRMRLRSYFLGLTGPMGALPLHLTEYGAYEARYSRDRPFGRFLDLLTDRMLQFFYRAWADSQPAVQADRPADDRFAGYVSAVSGAMDGADVKRRFPAKTRLAYAGTFAARRSRSAIQAVLRQELGADVHVREFVARWRTLRAQDQTRIGRAPHFNQLGGGAMLGRSVRTVEEAFRVEVTASAHDEYCALTPGGERFHVAAEVLDALTPPHLEWEIEIQIAEGRARDARLDGEARLGWTSWLAPRKVHGIRRETRLGARAARLIAAEFER